MKKIIALALAALIVCALPVMALAVDSPAAQEVVKIVVQKGKNDVSENQTVEVVRGTGTITVTADPTQGTFREWMIYKVEDDAATGAAIGELTAAAKYTKAVEGTDYEIVSGTLTTSPLTVKPLTDIVITGNYNKTVTTTDGKTQEVKMITDPQTGEAKETSPKTGANTAILVVIAVLALAGAGVATKKVLA